VVFVCMNNCHALDGKSTVFVKDVQYTCRHPLSCLQEVLTVAMSRVVVVAGYGRGISAAVSRKFGAEGFKLALLARTKSRLDESVAGPQPVPLQCASRPSCCVLMTYVTLHYLQSTSRRDSQPRCVP